MTKQKFVIFNRVKCIGYMEKKLTSLLSLEVHHRFQALCWIFRNVRC